MQAEKNLQKQYMRLLREQPRYTGIHTGALDLHSWLATSLSHALMQATFSINDLDALLSEVQTACTVLDPALINYLRERKSVFVDFLNTCEGALEGA